MSGNKIAELFATLGFQVDNKGLNAFEKNIKDIKKDLLLLSGIVTGAVFGLNKFISGTLQGSIELNDFNQKTGLSIQKLQQWQKAAQLTNLGISAEEVTSSVENLQKAITDIQMGRGDISPFMMSGVDVSSGNAFNVMEQLQGVLQNVNNATAVNVLQRMGISSQMLPVLKLTREEFDKLSKNKFLNNEQRKNILDLGLSIKKLKTELITLKDQAVAKIAPRLKELVDHFFSYLEKHGDKIISVISNLSKWFGFLIEGIGRMAWLITTGLESIFGFNNGLMAMVGIIALLMVKITPFRAILLGLFLILDDIATWMQGGDSLFGSFYEGVENFAKTLKNIFDYIWQTVQAIMDKISPFTSNATSFVDKANKNGFTADMGKVGKNATNSALLAGGLALAAAPFTGGLSLGGLLALMGTGAAIGGIGEYRGQQYEKANNSTTNNTFNINIDGSSSPEQVAQEIVNLSRQTLNTTI